MVGNAAGIGKHVLNRLSKEFADSGVREVRDGAVIGIESIVRRAMSCRWP